VLVVGTAFRRLGRKDGSFGIRYLFGGDIPHVLNLLIYVMKVYFLHASAYIFPNVDVIVIYTHLKIVQSESKSSSTESFRCHFFSKIELLSFDFESHTWKYKVPNDVTKIHERSYQSFLCTDDLFQCFSPSISYDYTERETMLQSTPVHTGSIGI
jgi:hypothetical protein